MEGIPEKKPPWHGKATEVVIWLILEVIATAASVANFLTTLLKK